MVKWIVGPVNGLAEISSGDCQETFEKKEEKKRFEGRGNGRKKKRKGKSF